VTKCGKNTFVSGKRNTEPDSSDDVVFETYVYVVLVFTPLVVLIICLFYLPICQSVYFLDSSIPGGTVEKCAREWKPIVTLYVL